MKKIHGLMFLIILVGGASAFGYIVKATNNMESPVTIRIEYKDAFGFCTDADTFALNAKETKDAPDRGACCARGIYVTLPDGRESFIFPGAGGFGIRCFDYKITVSKGKDGKAAITAN